MRTINPEALAIGRAVWAYYRHRAHSRIAAMVKYGELPDLYQVETACVYCGKTAALYEHRDYTDPLGVVPACYSCNQHVGPAILDPEIVIHHLRYSNNFPFSPRARKVKCPPHVNYTRNGPPMQTCQPLEPTTRDLRLPFDD